jgi:hypothetical protein
MEYSASCNVEPKLNDGVLKTDKGPGDLAQNLQILPKIKKLGRTRLCWDMLVSILRGGAGHRSPNSFFTFFGVSNKLRR